MDKKEIKNHLLTAEYGKFDFINYVVPKDVLLIAPPRIVVSYLVSELGILKTDINMSALRSWLFTYRKQPIKVKEIDSSIAPDAPTNTVFNFTDTKGTVSGKKFDF